MIIPLKVQGAVRLKNASQLPKRYYGLHMNQGVAEYNDPGFKGRVLVQDEAIKDMNQTGEGRPLYVNHVDAVDLANLQEESDGVVVRSFFNPPDGSHWIEFLVYSDEGHEAIAKKYTLSNAYMIKSTAPGGQYQGVQFDKEVVKGEFDHFALVPNPRYEQSKILTPEEFKSYNEALLLEIQKLANSNSKEPPVLNLFRKPKSEKVENAADIETLAVKLKSGTEKTIIQLVNEAEAHEDLEKKKAENGNMAEGEGYCMVGEHKMTVNELVDKHAKLQEAHNALVAEHEKLKGSMSEPGAPQAGAPGAKKPENAEAPLADPAKDPNDPKKPENESDDDKAMNAHFDALKNAPDLAARDRAKNAASEPVYESQQVQAQRGKSRYGSS